MNPELKKRISKFLKQGLLENRLICSEVKNIMDEHYDNYLRGLIAMFKSGMDAEEIIRIQGGNLIVLLEIFEPNSLTESDIHNSVDFEK